MERSQVGRAALAAIYQSEKLENRLWKSPRTDQINPGLELILLKNRYKINNIKWGKLEMFYLHALDLKRN